MHQEALCRNGSQRLVPGFWEAPATNPWTWAYICCSAGIGKAGRKLSYKAVVQGNGNLLIGKAYTAILELQPGDEYEIKLGRKQIRLIPVGDSEEEE